MYVQNDYDWSGGYPKKEDWTLLPLEYNPDRINQYYDHIVNVVTNKKILAAFQAPYNREYLDSYNFVSKDFENIKKYIESDYQKEKTLRLLRGPYKGGSFYIEREKLENYEQFKLIGEDMKQKSAQYEQDRYNRTERGFEPTIGFMITFIVAGIIMVATMLNNGGRNAEGTDAVINGLMVFLFITVPIGYFIYKKIKFKRLGEALEQAEDALNNVRKELERNKAKGGDAEKVRQLLTDLKVAKSKVDQIRKKINHRGPLEHT